MKLINQKKVEGIEVKIFVDKIGEEQISLEIIKGKKEVVLTAKEAKALASYLVENMRFWR